MKYIGVSIYETSMANVLRGEAFFSSTFSIIFNRSYMGQFL